MKPPILQQYCAGFGQSIDMKHLALSSLLLSAFCCLTANAASHLEILDEPTYAQTRYAIGHESCKLMWTVHAFQAPAFSVREMRTCDLQQHGTTTLVQLRNELLVALQQGRPAQAAPQGSAADEPAPGHGSAIVARRLADMRTLAMGSLQQMPHWHQALQAALTADIGWRTARRKLGHRQSNLALEKRLIEIANREAVFADLAQSFENTGYTLRLRNIEKLRFMPDGRLLDCQLSFTLTP